MRCAIEMDFYFIIILILRIVIYTVLLKSKKSLFQEESYMNKNSWKNFTQLLSKVGTCGQVGDYLILL